MDKRKSHKQQWSIVTRTSTGYTSLVYGPFDTLEGAGMFASREFNGTDVPYEIVPSIPVHPIA